MAVFLHRAMQNFKKKYVLIDFTQQKGNIANKAFPKGEGIASRKNSIVE